MSERENPVFKNQSTHKKFPPLNTPSPNLGVEGRGNFSSEFVKNHLNKNKAKLFKRKNRRKIPDNQLPLTQRDSSLLRKLNSFGLLSTQQIQKHIFNNIDKPTVLRRLRILQKRGWLRSSYGLPKGGLVWSLTKKGVHSCSYEGWIKTINRNTLQHDVLVSEVLFQLQRRNILLDWIPEHILKRQRIGSTTYLWRWHHENSQSLAPDGVLIAQHEGKRKKIAMEVEISKKSLRRYAKKIDFYQCRKEILFVWYVVLHKSFGENLLWLWRKKKTPYFSCGFTYSTLEEVMRKDFILPGIMEEEGGISKRERENKK